MNAPVVTDTVSQVGERAHLAAFAAGVRYYTVTPEHFGLSDDIILAEEEELKEAVITGVRGV